MVQIVDGGERSTAPGAPKVERKHEIKSSYDTEHILKSKFDAKVKNDLHHGLNKATAFGHIPDEDWNRIFGKK